MINKSTLCLADWGNVPKCWLPLMTKSKNKAEGKDAVNIATYYHSMWLPLPGKITSNMS